MGWYHGSTHRHKLDSTLPIYNLIKFEPIARCQKIKMTQTTVQYRRRLLYSIYSVLLYYCFFFYYKFLLSYFLLFNCIQTHFLMQWSDSYFFSDSIHSFLNLLFIDLRWLSRTIKEPLLLFLPLANGTTMSQTWYLHK